MIFPKRESNPEVLAKLVERIKVTDSNTSNDVSLLVGVLEQVKAAAAAGEALVLGPNAVHNLWTAVQALGSVHETSSIQSSIVRSKLFQQFLRQGFWHAHHVDLIWRHDGMDIREEADWLKDLWYALKDCRKAEDASSPTITSRATACAAGEALARQSGSPGVDPSGECQQQETLTPKPKRPMTDEQIKHMVNRFLGWRLPENFRPDAGISFNPEYNSDFNRLHGLPPSRHQPIGTNLLDAEQAEAMIRYLVEGLPNAVG